MFQSYKTLVIITSFVLVIFAIIVFSSLSDRDHEELIIQEIQKPWPDNKIIGKSVQGRNIESYTYGTGKKHIVFVGGIHGGYEWNTVLLAYELIDYFDTKKIQIPENITVTIIPSTNPDGLYKVVAKEGRFTKQDVPLDKEVLASGRFNANDVDLNRNFDCNWKPESKWRNKKVSAGSRVFSEPEAIALRDFLQEYNPRSVVFWHSQADTVYASQCNNGILPETIDIMNIYAKAAGYKAVKVFDSYEITGDATDWLASINIPAITVELTTHEDIELDKNIRGIEALLAHYSLKD